jgi:hypothetical protein
MYTSATCAMLIDGLLLSGGAGYLRQRLIQCGRCRHGCSFITCRWHVPLPGLLAKEVRDVAGALIRRQKRDDYLPRAATLAPWPFSHFCQREIIAKMRAQLHEGEPSGVLALAAIRAVEVRIVDVCEGGSL